MGGRNLGSWPGVYLNGNVNRNALFVAPPWAGYMSKKSGEIGPSLTAKRSTLSTRLDTIRYINEVRRRRIATVEQIAEALVADGYTSLDCQAKALGINRSTAWTIVKTKHKSGCLHRKTTQRILENPDTPPSVRAVVQKYLAERLDAASKSEIDD